MRRLSLTLVLAGLAAVAARPRVARAQPADDAWVLGDSDAKVTHDCGKQPRVVINASRDVVTLIGQCTRVTIDGGAVALVAESIIGLTVNGAGNRIVVAAVDAIAVTGEDNQIAWHAGVRGRRPHVVDLGSGDRIAQQK